MLSLKPIGSSSGEVGYYTQLGQEDYYVGGGEPPGTWWGTGAKALGLTNKVSGAAFGNLLQGRSADGKKSLVQNAGQKKRRSAFDLTWTVPKSVSVAWSQESQKGRLLIEKAGERALYRVLDVVQEYCGVSRRGHHGLQQEAAGLAAAIFRHDTARAVSGELPDPNLHWHVVLLNLSTREDGSTGALDARALFTPHMKMAFGALFRSELSKELASLGYASHRPVRNGKQVSWFELESVSDEMLGTFSKRRKEITAWLKERGLSGAKASELAANRTKHSKEQLLREDLLAAWQSVGKELGYECKSARGAPLVPKNLTCRDVERVAAEIAQGISHFSKLELIRRTAERYQAAGVGIGAILLAVDHAIKNSPEIIGLREQRGEQRFTTREVLAVEKRLLAAVERSRGSISCPSPSSVRDAIRNAPTLGDQQRDAVFHILESADRIACVNGMAGTGKTYMLGVARTAFENAGYRVLGTTLAAKASEGLEKGAGIRSIHIHRLLRQIELGKETLDAQTALVVDEAGMIGTVMMERLVTLTERAGAKLVLVGDYKQLQAIDAGGPFQAMCSRLGSADLTKITRQRDNWAKEAVTEMASGNADLALARYQQHGLLTVAKDRNEAMETLVDVWHRRGNTKDSLIFAGTRLEVAVLNRLCQKRRLAAGEIEQDAILVGGETLHVGDRVTFTRNNASLLVRNGNFGTVCAVDPTRGELRVELESGYRVCVSLAAYEHLSLAYAVTTHKGQGLTVESAYVLAGGAMTDRELSYVQTSRARGKTHIFTDEISSGDRLEMLARKMEQSRAKDLAHEYLIEAA